MIQIINYTQTFKNCQESTGDDENPKVKSDADHYRGHKVFSACTIWLAPNGTTHPLYTPAKDSVCRRCNLLPNFKYLSYSRSEHDYRLPSTLENKIHHTVASTIRRHSTRLIVTFSFKFVEISYAEYSIYESVRTPVSQYPWPLVSYYCIRKPPALTLMRMWKRLCVTSIWTNQLQLKEMKTGRKEVL